MSPTAHATTGASSPRSVPRPERVDWRSPRTAVVAVVFAALALVPVLAALAGQPFYVTLFTRIMIFALAATSLNLILGYGGLVSFGHSLYIGVGAYAVGVLSFHGVESGWLHLLAALVAAVAIAVPTGAVCLRTSGIAFIMITLAFAQMFFFLVVSLKYYGGDDGLTVTSRSDFAPFDISGGNGLYYAAFALLALATWLSYRVVHSRFGMVLRGAKNNARRMRALGFPVIRYQLTAYVISACACAVAGVLLANLTRFASPAYMAWNVSGDLILMVVLGGMGTVAGPVIGAIALLILEEVLTSITQHWMAVLGPIIVLIVLLAKRGLYGTFTDWIERRRRMRENAK
jgi:branched-chain amino acid transport system permease protein